MAEIYLKEFRLVLNEHIKAIEKGQPEFHSTEWFLIKYLRRIQKQAAHSASPVQVENSMRALIRFYVDNIDKYSPLGERCRLIHDQYRSILRNAHEKKNL